VPVPSPGSCGKKGIRHKTLGYTGIILAVICVAAASQLVFTLCQAGARESQQPTGSHIKFRMTSAKVIRDTQEDNGSGG